MNLIKLFLLLSSALLCVCGFADPTSPTREDILKAPPQINFDDWKEIVQLDAGVEYLETFPSPVHSGYSNNDVVTLRVFVPNNSNGPVPVTLIAHYWGATDLKAESALAANLNERGIAAAIITLPFHMERTPEGMKSGEMAVQPNPERLRQMMFQSEQDARRSLDFLDSRKEFLHDSYGFAGISLGALVAELTYAVDDRVSFATFALGGADFAHIIWNSSRVVVQKDILRKNGWNESKLRTALAPVEPLNYLPKSKAGTTFVIEGKFDSVVPHQCTEELIAKLRMPKVLHLETGHYGGIIVEGKILRTVADFFAAEMRGKAYNPPTHFSSFTLRFGALLAYPQGADLGVGLDLFHLDRNGDEFGSLFVTPRGIRFYAGQNLGYGISIGPLISARGPGAALMWSIVL